MTIKVLLWPSLPSYWKDSRSCTKSRTNPINPKINFMNEIEDQIYFDRMSLFQYNWDDYEKLNKVSKKFLHKLVGSVSGVLWPVACVPHSLLQAVTEDFEIQVHLLSGLDFDQSWQQRNLNWGQEILQQVPQSPAVLEWQSLCLAGHLDPFEV